MKWLKVFLITNVFGLTTMSVGARKFDIRGSIRGMRDDKVTLVCSIKQGGGDPTTSLVPCTFAAEGTIKVQLQPKGGNAFTLLKIKTSEGKYYKMLDDKVKSEKSLPEGDSIDITVSCDDHSKVSTLLAIREHLLAAYGVATAQGAGMSVENMAFATDRLAPAIEVINKAIYDSCSLDIEATDIRKIVLANVEQIRQQLKERKTPSCPGCYLQEASLDGMNLDKANFAGADLQKASLRESTLVGANLRGAKFNNACLQKTQFIGADLVEAQLENADLQDARLDGASLQRANLKKANMRETGIESANLENADLTEVYLFHRGGAVSGSRAFLNGAKLHKATVSINLTDASLVAADLTNADLSYTLLDGANLDRAILNGAQLTGVQCSGKTKLPSGYDCVDYKVTSLL